MKKYTHYMWYLKKGEEIIEVKTKGVKASAELNSLLKKGYRIIRKRPIDGEE